MKTLLLVFIFLCLGHKFTEAKQNKLVCQALSSEKIPTAWIDMTDDCDSALRDQIIEEFTASMAYLQMAAHFSRDIINRPGFAELFFHASHEERDHGIKLIEYLLMRGQLPPSFDLSFLNLKEKNFDDDYSGVQALSDALELEAHVTQKIRGVISACESGKKNNEVYNDYHLVDYLTGVYLEEQHKGQRDLAGKASTLSKMMAKPLGEYLFDKSLLE